MGIALGAIGLVAGGCNTCSAAEPPPPFSPSFTADDALARLRASPCAAALNGHQVAQVGLRGFESADGPVVILDLEVTSPSSKLGVRYRTTTSIHLVPTTGDVRDGPACTTMLGALVAGLSRATGLAEQSPDVRRFVAEHPPADRIAATYESPVQPRGRILFVAPAINGVRATLTWE